MLFSEPKIPQFFAIRRRQQQRAGFSALQRAENSSISVRVVTAARTGRVSVLFSEPKIPQCSAALQVLRDEQRFSALQRAENSSMYVL